MPRPSLVMKKAQRKKEPPNQLSRNRSIQNECNTHISTPTETKNTGEALLTKQSDTISAPKIKANSVKRKHEQAEPANVSGVKKAKVLVTTKPEEPPEPQIKRASELKSLPFLLDINDNSNTPPISLPNSQISTFTEINSIKKKVPVNKKTPPPHNEIFELNAAQPANNDDLKSVRKVGTENNDSSSKSAKTNDDPKSSDNIANTNTASDTIPNSTNKKIKAPRPKVSQIKKMTLPDSPFIPIASPSQIKETKEEKSHKKYTKRKRDANESKTEMVYVAAGLKEDCEELVQRCLRVYRLNFDKFSEIWKQMNFALIFSGRQSSAELAELSEEAIHIAKMHMVAKNTLFEENIAGLFLVYAFLNLQPYTDFAALRLTPDDVPSILYLENEARKQRRHDVIYILGAVLIKGPCQCHVLPREVALELPYRKYFDGSIQSDIPSGALTKTCEAATAFKDVISLDQRYSDIKAQVAARFPYGQLTGSKQIGIPLLHEFRQMVNNITIESSLEVKLNEIKPPEQMVNRVDVVSSIKAKAMANTVDPIKHLTGVKERQQYTSPLKQNELVPSPKGKGKGKGKKGRSSAKSLNILFEQPTSKNFVLAKKHNVKLASILAMTDNDLEVKSPTKQLSLSPNNDDGLTRKSRKNSEGNASKAADGTAHQADETINTWLGSKTDVKTSKISDGSVTLFSDGSVSKTSEKNTPKSSSNSSKSQIGSPQKSIAQKPDSEDVWKKSKSLSPRAKQIVRKKKKPKPDPISDSDDDSDELEQLFNQNTKLKKKVLNSTPANLKEPLSLQHEDSDDSNLSDLSNLSGIESNKTLKAVKDRLAKIIDSKVKRKMLESTPSKRGRSRNEPESPVTRRITRSESLSNSPASTIKTAEQIRRKRVQKRDLKRLRVKSAFKRLGMLEVANFNSANGSKHDASTKR